MMHTDTEYLYLRNRIYYYYRRIPAQFRELYRSSRVSRSLGTSSYTAASKAAATITSQLDGYWCSIRVANIIEPMVFNKPLDSNQIEGSLTLLEAMDLYLRVKGRGKRAYFPRYTSRNVDRFVSVLGDLPLTQYKSTDGCKVRDELIASGLAPATISRIFCTGRAVVKFAISELGLGIPNPFDKIFLPIKNNERSRPVLSESDIKMLQGKGRALNEELFWFVLLISDTGMRLSEALGLRTTDFNLDVSLPYVELAENKYRLLKTKQSARTIPLVGASLWAAKKLLARNYDTGYVFESYLDEGEFKTSLASVRARTWIRSFTLNNESLHSLRHSMRDRLREVQCPSEIIDSICGWAKRNAGERYGLGYSLTVKSSWLEKVVIS